MDIGFAIIKGLVQGLTEFLPVSSTAHLIFTETLLKRFGLFQGAISLTEAEAFDVLLHIGTLAALFAYFCRDVADWAKNPLQNRTLRLLMISLMVTTILVLGVMHTSEAVFSAAGWDKTFGVRDLSEFYRSDFRWVAFHLTITGVILFWIESRVTQKSTQEAAIFTPDMIAHMPIKNALVIGLFQTLAAIFHGISRSGSTITGGMLSGLSRLAATRYAFMLGIPTFMAAALYEGLKVSKHLDWSTLHWQPMVIGTLVSAVVGYSCVAFFVNFVAKHSLKPFAYYCWGAVLAMFWLMG
ncbi:MAG: undecaprenyl-diphosphate phosphatase [Vampirovibrionales bacterium]|nr:undecaprenyl-diphosphate phosphatase [Vampirovibrionales bacterium]